MLNIHIPTQHPSINYQHKLQEKKTEN